MSKKSVADLITIAQHGGGFELDANDYTFDDLAAIASRLYNSATLRLRKVDKWSTDDLSKIAQHAPPGVVQFVFGG
jgi:hypothetical protein